MAEQKPIDDISARILGALQGVDEALGCGDVAKKIGVPTSQVVCRMAPLRKRGLIESPDKGKYVLTEEGAKTAR